MTHAWTLPGEWDEVIHCLGDLFLLPSGSSGAGSRPTTTSPAACGTTQGFLRTIGEARLITPLRSAGGHRRYSRYQLRIAARARELVDRGTPIEAACRIVILEDQLEQAQQLNAAYRRGTGTADSRSAV
jgi:hypothetical protein